MRRSYLWIIAIFIISFTACKNADKIEVKEKEDLVITNKLPFEGIWTRSFELAKDSIQQVFYRVWTDSIQYEMQGSLPIKYTMYKDTFISKENKWIGKLKEVPYVLFVKINSKDSITLFKKQAMNNSEALQMKTPHDSVSSHYSSWNTYYLKK